MIHNLITSRAVPELITELGGVLVRTRVGHCTSRRRWPRPTPSSAASTAATSTSVTSGGQTRDARRPARPGRLAETDGPLSELLGEYERYVVSGEINSTVDDQAAVTAEIERAYAGDDTVTTDHLDGSP